MDKFDLQGKIGKDSSESETQQFKKFQMKLKKASRIRCFLKIRRLIQKSKKDPDSKTSLPQQKNGKV